MRTGAGMNACCATAAATTQEGPKPDLAKAPATGKAGNRAKINNTTPATTHKTRGLGAHSWDLTAAAILTPMTQL